MKTSRHGWVVKAVKAARALGCVALVAGPLSMAQAADGPRGNLLVSWRVSGGADASRQAQGLRAGQVVIDSRRGVSGRAGVEWSSQQAQVEQRVEQQVMVLNGGRARIDLRQQRPVTQWQWVAQFDGLVGGRPPSTVPQASLVSETVWVDSGQGLAVKPRWAGGRSPVVVDLEAQAPVPSASAGWGRDRAGVRDGAEAEPAQLTVQTTVTVPLGEWVAVASTRQQQARQQSGTWRTADIEQDERAVLEIRVSLP